MTKANPRLASYSNIYNKYDPLFWLLDRVVFAGLFHPKKHGRPGEHEILDTAEQEFLVENLNKHRLILWLNTLLGFYLYFIGLDVINQSGDKDIVVAGLLAPAMVTGGAWFTVSFGGIPEKFVSIAFVLTFWMFTAFSLSMTLLVALLCSISPWPIAFFVIVPIYFGLYVASLLYDNVDGLKIGLDSTLLKFSRASLNYYQKHGYVTAAETQKEVYNISDSDSEMSDKIASFTNYISLLNSNLTQLEGAKKHEQVANHLIASSMDLIFRITQLPMEKPIDKGDEKEYQRYVFSANKMRQHEVDEATIGYLYMALENLRIPLGTNRDALADIDRAYAILQQFEQIRSEERGISAGDLSVSQELADYLFSQVFKQLLSLMQSHRHSFLKAINSHQ